MAPGGTQQDVETVNDKVDWDIIFLWEIFC